MTLRTSIPKTKNNLYYDENFRKVLEDHIGYILNNHAHVQAIKLSTSAAWRSDFYGLVRDILPNFPENLMWLILRLNGLTSPTEWSGTRDNIILTEPETINQLIAANYNSI